jgi:hypothetical protein
MIFVNEQTTAVFGSGYAGPSFIRGNNSNRNGLPRGERIMGNPRRWNSQQRAESEDWERR